MLVHRDEEEDLTIYKVVVNHEEQYSIWPADRDNPAGWFDVAKSGVKQECLDYIQAVWTDMRPLSLRQQMAEQAHQQLSTVVPPAPAATHAEPAMESLVQRLSTGHHPVVASRAHGSAKALQASIARGYVHITFTATRGGTELGMRLDDTATDLSQGDFDQATGTLHLVGHLTLDYVRVRCQADIDLATLQGTGHLEPVEA
jgi:uncharacterized protein YbdZ (MbtH family)